MSILQDIFIKVARKLGLTLQPKTENRSDYNVISDVSLTAILADRLSTLTLMDSSIQVQGNNKRAECLNDVCETLWAEHIKTACMFAIGTGDCLIKPNTDGKRIGIDIIGNSEFSITEYIGGYINGVIIKCDEIKKNNTIYQRLEYHSIKEENGVSSCHIKQLAFKDGIQIPITRVSEWENFPEEMIIPNVDKLLFGRIKCPTVNRANANSPNGVPITFGNEKILKEAKMSYDRFNKEFFDKETLIFADKALFRTDDDGNAYIPKGKKNMFVKLKGSGVDKASLETFSPDIRDASHDIAIERNLRMLELGCGIGEGVLSKSTLTYTNVDEVRASRSATYAFMTNFRKAIDKGTEDFIEAVNIICNANNITPIGNYEYVSDWSDSYMQSSVERFNQLLQAETIGAVDLAEVRAEVQAEDLDVAKEKVEEIKANKPKVADIDFTNLMTD